ncbi:serine/threonine-protein kinase [Pseudonocardia sp. N23]|uniref:serine/threonine-protein kinase n=1 Tax=Pseudonocardia sp. N23 TaxID=1987376 RepID=UPI000BFD7AD2|nr:serine/threonine-protein kinase [Pseudonocardia sp. N23]GAY09932.1 putative serine/threonine protein kinase [Pseudonocardia sp. N23]
MTGTDPRSVGPFTIHRVLGEGGMGRVYLGRSRDGREAAVKVVRAALADDPEFRARFRQEVAAAARVHGTYTAALLGADPDAPAPWMATEYVPAPSLRDAIVEHGPMPAESVRRLGIGLADALAAIHAAGVVHRDLKPGNVLLAHDGPKVIDFGIARAADATTLTRTGAVIGTPGFIAPEVLTHGRAGAASDVFALGGVLLYATTGRAPFGEGEAAVLLFRAANVEPDLTGVPAPLASVVRACLDRDPARRPTPAQVRDRLGGDRDRPTGGWLPARLEPSPLQPVARRRLSPVLAIGVVAAVIALVGGLVLALRSDPDDPSAPPTTFPTGLSIPATTLTLPTITLPPATTGAAADVTVAPAATGFSTPSNNIACYVTPNSARCDIAESTWDPTTIPARPATCQQVWGDSLAVSGADRPTFACHGDTVFGTGAVLDYGRSLRVGDVTCTSRTSGVECKVGSSGHGFSMSKGAYQFF